MATGGVLGNGTKLAFSLDSPLSLQRVGQLKDIPDIMNLEADIVDTTVHGTLQIMTAMPGMIPQPEMPFTVNADMDQATSATLETLRKLCAGSGDSTQGTTVYWRCEVPVNRAQTSFRAVEFRGWVRSFKLHTPITDVQTVDLGIVFDDTVSPTWYNAGASQIS